MNIYIYIYIYISVIIFYSNNGICSNKGVTKWHWALTNFEVTGKNTFIIIKHI